MCAHKYTNTFFWDYMRNVYSKVILREFTRISCHLHTNCTFICKLFFCFYPLLSFTFDRYIGRIVQPTGGVQIEIQFYHSKIQCFILFNSQPDPRKELPTQKEKKNFWAHKFTAAVAELHNIIRFSILYFSTFLILHASLRWGGMCKYNMVKSIMWKCIYRKIFFIVPF